MENTLENKAKLFAQYMFQKVCIETVDVTYPMQIIGIDHDLGVHVYDSGIKLRAYYPTIDLLLELKPLSSITDEDVLKIAELLPWGQKISETAIIAQTKELIHRQFQTNLYREHWSDIIDKIRELGYAHKWNGVNVERQIEYGWIKLKTIRRTNSRTSAISAHVDKITQLVPFWNTLKLTTKKQNNDKRRTFKNLLSLSAV